MASAEAVQAGLEAGFGIDAPKKRSGKKLVLFIILPLLTLIAIGAGLYFTGIIGGKKGEQAAEEKKKEEPKTFVFFDLPDLLVNLSSTGKRTNYLKIKVSLELAKPEDVPTLQTLAPRVIDNFQIYLRELRTTDLQGSAGLARLREELLRRVNAAVEPIKVRDVLFKEMLVQ